MSCLIRGAHMKCINTRGLPSCTPIWHYVYPNLHYKYDIRSDKTIVLDSEIAIFSIDKIKGIDKDCYPRSTKYFLFTESFKGTKSLIQKRKFITLTQEEAEKIHYYLLRKKLICVFPRIQESNNPVLHQKLISEKEFLEKEAIHLTPLKIVNNVFGKNYTTGKYEPKIRKRQHDDIIPYFSDEEKEEIKRRKF